MDWFLHPVSAGDKILVMVVAIIMFAAFVGVIVYLIDRPRVPNWLVVTGLIGPILIVLAGGLLWPTLKTIWESFQRSVIASGADGKPILDPITKKRQTTGEFSFDNYGKIFTNDGLQTTLINTLLWTLLVPILATAIGLVYAVIIDRTRFEKAAKALIFIPMAISMVGASVIWRFVYQYRGGDRPQVGLINAILNSVGVGPVNFFETGLGSTLAMIVVMIWIQAGFAMTILSAAIKGVPDDVVEAARIDGATGMRLFTSITIPSIRPALVVVLTTIAISSLKAYDIVQTMAGSDRRASVIATEFIRQQGNPDTRGVAAALAVLLFIIVVPIIIYNVKQMKLAEEMR